MYRKPTKQKIRLLQLAGTEAVSNYMELLNRCIYASVDRGTQLSGWCIQVREFWQMSYLPEVKHLTLTVVAIGALRFVYQYIV